MKKNSKLSIKVSFSDTFNDDDLAFARAYLPSSTYVLGTLLLYGVTLWRAQIANTQTAISKKEIQSLPCMKFTSKLFNGVSEVDDTLSAFAVCKSSFFDMKEYVNIAEEDKFDFIKERIEITSKRHPGKAKILLPRQIVNFQDLTMHRKGWVARIKGTLTSMSIFKPDSFIKGININVLSWNQLVDIIIASYLSSGISEQELLSSLSDSITKYNLSSDAEEDLPKSSKEAINKIFSSIKFLLPSSDERNAIGDGSSLVFDDGIIVSSGEVNKVP